MMNRKSVLGGYRLTLPWLGMNIILPIHGGYTSNFKNKTNRLSLLWLGMNIINHTNSWGLHLDFKSRIRNISIFATLIRHESKLIMPTPRGYTSIFDFTMTRQDTTVVFSTHGGYILNLTWFGMICDQITPTHGGYIWLRYLLSDQFFLV